MSASPELHDIAQAMVSPGRGVLAADESIGTMSSRLEGEGIEGTEDNRRGYRELLASTPGLDSMVSGIILCDETFRQNTSDGQPFPQACRVWGILPGIKVDTGTTPLAGAGGAVVTEGLDGLGARLADYAERGAAFAKWRAVIDPATVSSYSLAVNAHALARYAALCQEHGIVPIVEPEVLAAGGHTMARTGEVTRAALDALFGELARQRVDLAGIVLKPNMVTPGLAGAGAPPREAAAATLAVLYDCVPPEVPGIAFLSGGQSNLEACSNLAAINELAANAPWRLTFSFGRALVSDALRMWAGKDDQVDLAQQVLGDNCARAASATASLATRP